MLPNINIPYKSNPFEITLGVLSDNKSKIAQNHKILSFPKEIKKEFLNETHILDQFKSLNSDIRHEDNIASDTYYDAWINQSIIDATKGLIEKDRYF